MEDKTVVFEFNPTYCKACGICAAFCPKSVIERDEEGKPVFAHKENCIGCGMCELRCPDYAIRMRREA